MGRGRAHPTRREAGALASLRRAPGRGWRGRAGGSDGRPPSRGIPRYGAASGGFGVTAATLMGKASVSVAPNP